MLTCLAWGTWSLSFLQYVKSSLNLNASLSVATPSFRSKASIWTTGSPAPSASNGDAVMLQYAARRSCATTLKRGRIGQWRPPACAQTPCRSRSAGPAAVSDMNVWAKPDPAVPLQQQGGVAAVTGRDMGGDDALFTRTSTSLGRDVGRMVRSSQDILEPEVCNMQPDFLPSTLCIVCVVRHVVFVRVRGARAHLHPALLCSTRL